MGYDFERLRQVRFTPEQALPQALRAPRLLNYRQFNVWLDPETSELLGHGRPETQVTLVTPVQAGGETVAVLNLDRFGSAQAFGSGSLRAAAAFATQVGLLLQRRRLEDELERRRHHDAHLNALLVTLETLHDPHEIITRALETLLALTRYPSVSYYRLETAALHLEAALQREGGAAPQEFASRIAGNLRELLAAGQPIIVPDAVALTEQDLRPELRPLVMRSMAAVPVRSGSAPHGLLVASSPHEALAPDTLELKLLEYLAGRLGNALERVRVQQNLERRVRRLSMISEVGELMRPLFDVQSIYQAITDCARQAAQASNASVLLYQPQDDTLQVMYCAGRDAAHLQGVRLRRNEGLSWLALESGQSFFAHNAALEPRVVNLGEVSEHGANFLAVPLTDVDGRPIGVLAVDTEASDHQFSQEDQALLEALAHAAGAKIHRLSMLDRSRLEARAYRALAEFGAAIEAESDPDLLTELGLGRLRELLGFEMAAEYDVLSGTATLRRCWGDYPQAMQNVREIHTHDNGAIATVLGSGEIMYIAHYDGWNGAHPIFRELGLRSGLFLPLIRQGRVIRICMLGSYHGEVHLEEVHLTIARSFMRRLEHTLERNEVLRELRAAREAALRVLGLALEYRDYETQGHTDRVVALCGRFGTALGLGEESQGALKWGAYLHDIGKLAIPDRVLFKPGALTAEEQELMRRHAQIGWEMCQDIPFLPDMTRDIVRWHHERWDGSGYPDGLSGEGIPLVARIFSLVDVYDALTSERPYKPPWSAHQSLNYIEAQSGIQFDPELSRQFVQLLRAEELL
nr:HD domain-containing phosphohydrolase [Deinobacterium chartae]